MDGTEGVNDIGVEHANDDDMGGRGVREKGYGGGY